MKLCGTTINFYVHINFKVLKKVKHGKNVLVVHVLRIWKKKFQKKKNVGTSGTKFVKREKLAHFWHGYLFLRVNE